MNVHSIRLGTLDVTQEDILVFPEGIPGVETVQEYCLVPHAAGSPFHWLQATSFPALAFVLVDPFEFFPEYDLIISDVDANALELNSIEDVRIFVIVTFSPTGMTANLTAPIIMNRHTRRAKQIILMDVQYSCRHQLMPAAQPATPVVYQTVG